MSIVHFFPDLTYHETKTLEEIYNKIEQLVANKTPVLPIPKYLAKKIESGIFIRTKYQRHI